MVHGNIFTIKVFISEYLKHSLLKQLYINCNCQWLRKKDKVRAYKLFVILSFSDIGTEVFAVPVK